MFHILYHNNNIEKVAYFLFFKAHRNKHFVKNASSFFLRHVDFPGLSLVSSGGKEMFHSPPGCRVAFHLWFWGVLRPKMLPLKPVRVKFQGSVGLFTMIPMRFLWSEWQAKVSYRELQHQKADLEKVCLHHLFCPEKFSWIPLHNQEVNNQLSHDGVSKDPTAIDTLADVQVCIHVHLPYACCTLVYNYINTKITKQLKRLKQHTAQQLHSWHKHNHHFATSQTVLSRAATPIGPLFWRTKRCLQCLLLPHCHVSWNAVDHRYPFPCIYLAESVLDCFLLVQSIIIAFIAPTHASHEQIQIATPRVGLATGPC